MPEIQGIFRSGPMSYEDYDEDYPCVFAKVARTIQAVLPSAEVAHVGSTAVPGLGGRRVLDIVLPAERAKHDEIVTRLLHIGFVKSPFTHFQPMLTGSIRYHEKDYPILLYILPEESEIYQGWIAFRSYMQQHPEEVERYAEVKRRALADGKTDARSYQQAKTPYLESLIARMR
jgi:GrpB-like predicted nucleotidyltransferase (UPF0157 family)